jgi:hypothetical protein
LAASGSGPQAARRRLPRLLLVALASAAAACQLKTSPAAIDSISAAAANVVIVSSERLTAQPAGNANQSLVVLKVAVTNAQSSTRTISPNDFVLLDMSSQSEYVALSGGDARATTAAVTLAPAKSAEMVLVFRVPLAFSVGRLFLRQ